MAVRSEAVQICLEDNLATDQQRCDCQHVLALASTLTARLNKLEEKLPAQQKQRVIRVIV